MDFSNLPQLHPVSLRDEGNSWRDIDWISLMGRLIISGVIWGFALMVVVLAYGGGLVVAWAVLETVEGLPG